MLPSLSLLKSNAIATAGHESKQYKKGQGDLNILKDLPEELQRKVLEVATDGLGVPLLLVRNVLYEWNTQLNMQYRSKDDIFYIRLPDHADGRLDVERFIREGYPYEMIFQGIVDLAGYNETTTKTTFINIKPTDGLIPPQLVSEEGDGTADVFDLVADAVRDTGVAVDEQQFFRRNADGEQLLFARFPTFKSHVAIVMVIEDYD